MTRQALIQDIDHPEPSADDVIKILDRASRYWLNGDRTVEQDVEIVIRLLDKQEVFESVLAGSIEVIEALAREAGLYPYIDDTDLIRDLIARDAHRVPEMEGYFFHTEQMKVFKKLVSGKNIILSAPTSFGKTLLVDAYIASKKPHTVVMVVPTIALLEERRRALIQRFPVYQIITQSFQERGTGPTIIVGTQERILERDDITELDLLVIDEFYKLDLSSTDSRAPSLNLLLAKYLKLAKQVYLLGPSIQENPVNEEGPDNFEFYRTQYSPVTADIIMADPIGTNPDTLASLLVEEKECSSLVYCRSPKSTRDVSRQLVEKKVCEGSERLKSFATWMRENYHSEWYVADALEHGIGIHHGRIPRSIAHLMVKLFNIGEIKILLCTSSLIEGVNTAAENVMIYDKYISIRSLDRFTFDNIKGRAGRMFEHFVGRIYLFNEPPEPVYENLEIPLLQSKDKVSDQELFQLSADKLSKDNLHRRNDLLETIEVPEEILMRYAKFGIENLKNLHQEISEVLEAGETDIVWSGIGRYEPILASMDCVWGKVDFQKHGVRTPAQFAFLANKLVKTNTIYDFINAVANGDDIDDSIDKAFNFLKGAEYSFVDPMNLVQDLVRAHLPSVRIDYTKFLADLASWGMPGHSKALEEVGIPIPIGQKMENIINLYDYDEALSGMRKVISDGTLLTKVELDLLSLTFSV